MTTIAPKNSNSLYSSEFIQERVQKRLVDVLNLSNPKNIGKFKRIISNIETISSFSSEHFPMQTINKTIAKFTDLMPFFMQKYKNPKSFTHKRIYTYYLAILDAYLSHITEKVSPLHFELMIKRGLITESKVCSYLEMKKKQLDLQNLNKIDDPKPLQFSELIKKRIKEMLREFSQMYEVDETKLQKLNHKANEMLNMRMKPHISLDEAAGVVIGVLMRYFFKGLKKQREFREFLNQNYVIDSEQIKRKTQEFRERMNKKKVFSKLGLKKMTSR